MSVPKLNSKSKAFVPRWKMSGSSSETPATSTPPVPLHPPTGALFSKAPTCRPKQAKIQISPQNARANHPIDLTQPLFVHPQQQYPPFGVHSSTLVPPSQTSPSSQTQKQFSSPKSGNDGIGSTAATILEYIRNETSFSQSQINTFQRPFAPNHNQNNPYFPRASESSITLVSCYGTFLRTYQHCHTTVE
ncbi:hypothetical protein BLNAU_356 [Blattamonas nauphoetae]|uniref:Uncharacterized protein n=1 Tax=Blattamonas nauphoetae TaxID=2049346 RepID=A0ABQ9YL02_9EUKA|nr:hypothetical protein BLNAU_356 [Blattamonas nauphoetae]